MTDCVFADHASKVMQAKLVTHDTLFVWVFQTNHVTTVVTTGIKRISRPPNWLCI